MHPYLTKYCSKEHAQASMFYQKQLSTDPVFLRSDITYVPYGQSPYEQQTASLEELEYISKLENITLQQAARQFAIRAVNAVKSQIESTTNQTISQQQEEDGINKLVDKMEVIKITERDPNDTTMDDLVGVDDELIGDPNAVEGYKAKN